MKDRLQITVNQPQSAPAWVHSTPMTFTQHFSNTPSLCTAHVLWLTLCTVTFDILVKVWKALHTNECTKWLFRGGGREVWIVWSFDIINYKAITLIFKVSTYWRFCLQTVWSSDNDGDDGDGIMVKRCSKYWLLFFIRYNITFYNMIRHWLLSPSCLMRVAVSLPHLGLKMKAHYQTIRVSEKH